MGSAIVSQILHYLMINGPNMIHVFNGLKPGQGDAMFKVRESGADCSWQVSGI